MSQFDARYSMPFADRHIGPRKEDLAAMSDNSPTTK
jgi:hypothetical protein